MDLPIEILGVAFVFLIIVIMTFYKIISGWLAKRRYKPENDKSRLAEEKRRRLLEADKRAGGTESKSQRSGFTITESSGSEIKGSIQTGDTNKDGQNSSGSGKLGSWRRRIFFKR